MVPRTTPTSTCPFCAIAAAHPPAPLSPPPPSSTPTPTAHIILSTPHILAFLDHAPISRGHVLVVVRPHREKLSEVRIAEGAAVGRWLGVLSRAVVGAVGEDTSVLEGGRARGGEGARSLPLDEEGEGEGLQEEEEEEEVGDWNVVQNNGARAAQVVPHVHFHIIPRVGDVPEVRARSWTVFGKGQREELDEEDAGVLVRRMRVRVGREVERVRRREGEDAVRELLGWGEEGMERVWSKL